MLRSRATPLCAHRSFLEGICLWSYEQSDLRSQAVNKNLSSLYYPIRRAPVTSYFENDTKISHLHKFVQILQNVMWS